MTFTLLCLQMINKLIYVYILKYSKYHPHKKNPLKDGCWSLCTLIAS